MPVNDHVFVLVFEYQGSSSRHPRTEGGTGMAKDPAPGGGHYRFAWGAQMNNRGDIVYMGDLSTPPDLFTVAGIFAHSGGSSVAIARPGDPMPGGGTIVTVNPAFANGNYSINNGGDISFNADETRAAIGSADVFFASKEVAATRTKLFNGIFIP